MLIKYTINNYRGMTHGGGGGGERGRGRKPERRERGRERGSQNSIVSQN